MSMPVGEGIDDRMKWYEGRPDAVFLPMLPVMARLDGRSFHRFTHDLERPFDERFYRLMIETTRHLVGESNARCGYTQSDEITLMFYAEEWGSEVFFGGRLMKLTSVLASMATAFFNRRLPEFLPAKRDQLPVFDNRTWQVPGVDEAVNCFVWREQDATRNSVQMAARAHFSHRQCHEKNNAELLEMLFAKGINWNDYPNHFKRGTYVRRRRINRAFTPEELELLPPKHEARTNPDLEVKRTAVTIEEFPPLMRIANRVGVIVSGEEPKPIETPTFNLGTTP